MGETWVRSSRLPVRAQRDEVEAVAEFGQQVGFPAHVVRQQGRGALGPQAGDEGDEAVEGAGVRLAVRQRALGHGAGGEEEGEGERVVHGQGGGGVDQFAREGAELVGEAGDPAGLHEVAGLPDRGLGAGGAAAGEAGVAAVGLGEQRDHGAAFAERAGVQDDGGGLPFHVGDMGRGGAAAAPPRTRPWLASQTPFAKSRGRQSPAIGMGEAVQHEADRGQGDHRLGDLG